MKKIFFLFLILTHCAYAQEYTFSALSQGAVNKTNIPKATALRMSKDTTYTIFENAKVPMELYFVDGDGKTYNNLFNPNPTGIFLNKQHFKFHCDPEKSVKHNATTFLDMYEFNYLGKDYLCLFSFWEECSGKDCQYRCYNLYDLSDPNRIKQASFSSIYEGSESFGDFNFDGILDFLRAAFKKTEKNSNKNTEKEDYLITAFTFNNGKTVQLKNDKGESNYIIAKGDKEVKKFQILQHDWIIPLKDSTGKKMEITNYFPPYIAFDPRDSHLFNESGAIVEKNRWSVIIGEYSDLEGAQSQLELMKKRQQEEVYFIMSDQYNGTFNFMVLQGNYQEKEKALQLQKILKNRFQIDGRVTDLKSY